MILRLAAMLALLLGAGTLLAFLRVVGRGPFAPLEARHLRAMKDRLDPPATAEPWTLADFERLPHGESVAEYSGRERKGVVVDGYVQTMVRASDGDIHLELVAVPRAAGGRDTAYVTAEISPGVRRGRWSWNELAAVFRPNRGAGGPWDGGPQRVRLTGWLLYDVAHDPQPSEWMRVHAAPRLTGWEIHPVMRIERWSGCAWREVPR